MFGHSVIGKAAYVRRPAPDEVPGYARAVELGLTPQVPATTPALVCPPSYAGVLSTALLALGTSVVAVVTTAWWSILLIAAVFVRVIFVLRGMQCREQLEVAAGYRLVEWRSGGWGRDPEGRFGEGMGFKAAPWDLRGLWHLDAGGKVLAEPDRSVLPPGRYPSPNRPGEMELWSGAVWMYGYETPAEPFLPQ